MKRLTRAEWRKTPYALSESADPDAHIRKLLDKYKIVKRQFTESIGPSGRPQFILRFELNDLVYRIDREVLLADAPPDSLMRQVKRAVYYWLKVTLEDAVCWGPLEKLLLHAVESKDGVTVYEWASPNIPALQSAGSPFLALPAKGDHDRHH